MTEKRRINLRQRLARNQLEKFARDVYAEATIEEEEYKPIYLLYDETEEDIPQSKDA